MAGKVYFNCWRHDLVPDLRMYMEEEEYIDLKQITTEDFIYTGPFFLSCDHGCYHGNNTHGVMGQGCVEPDIEGKMVQEKCFEGINRADIVYAWLDSEDSFGTFVELGYAYSLGKEIWIGYPSFNVDMWFVYQTADKFLEDKCPKCAFRKLLKGKKTYLNLDGMRSLYLN